MSRKKKRSHSPQPPETLSRFRALSRPPPGLPGAPLLASPEPEAAELLPPPEVGVHEAPPLPVAESRPPEPPRPPAVPPRRRDDVPAPVPAPPREPSDVSTSREVLAEANRILSPWKEVVLTPEPPFATRREALVGLAVALVSASLGFVMTHGRLDRLARAASPIDRRAAVTATGDSQQAQFRAPDPGDPISYLPYAGPQLPPGSFPNTGPVLADLSSGPPPGDTPVPSATAPASPSAIPTATPAPPAQTSRPAPVPAAGTASHPAVSQWPPAPSPRRPEMTLDAAWRQVQPSIVHLQPGANDAMTGVIVDTSGLVATRWSALDGKTSVLVATAAGGTVTATLLGGVDGIDVALLKLPPGSWQAAPLAPEAPDDQPLALVSAQRTDDQVAAAHPEGPAPGGAGLFRFAGVLGPSDPGNVLVNARGEVAGLVLGKPDSFPGSIDCLAVDTSALWQVMQAQARQGLVASLTDTNLTNTQFKAMLTAQLPPDDSRGAPGTDVVAGVSVGVFHLGMSLSTLQKTIGTIADATPLADSGWSMLQEPTAQMDFILANDRVVAVRTTNPQFTTRRGLGVGALYVNIDLQREAGSWSSGQWTDGESYMLGPGLELWGGNGKVTRLLVEPVRASVTNRSGDLSLGASRQGD